MMGLFGSLSQYYYLVLVLQGICVFHSIRRGNQARWIWIIVFLPVIGCIAYLFTEVFNKRDVSSLQSGVAKLVNPGGKIKELEKRYEFTQTFANRVALADAYLEKGQHERAIELYEPALSGLFDNNEHVIEQLIQAYYALGRFHDVIKLAPRIATSLTFSKKRANLLYALSLEKTGNIDLALNQFKAMNHRFSNYEARYNYGLFLLRNNMEDEAAKTFNSIADEAAHMNRKEKGESKVWIDKALEEWNKLPA